MDGDTSYKNQEGTQQSLICSKSTKEALEKGVYVKIVKTPERHQWRLLIFLLLTLNICTPFSNVSFDDSEQTNDNWVHLKGYMQW